VERAGSHPSRGRAPDGCPEDEPAIRGAAEIVARVEADEAAADEARERYRTQAMPALEPDTRISPLLASDECVVAVRRSAQLDRRQPMPGWDAPPGLAGDLYLTSRRLVLVGRQVLSFDLGEIAEVGVSGERLLLVMCGGKGVSLDVAQPRLLRVEVAAARAFART
jgi:hypothetical protein